MNDNDSTDTWAEPAPRLRRLGRAVVAMGLVLQGACAGVDTAPISTDELLCGGDTGFGERYHPGVMDEELAADPRLVEMTSVTTVSTCEQARAVRRAQAALDGLPPLGEEGELAGVDYDDEPLPAGRKILDGAPSYDRSTVKIQAIPGRAGCSAVHIRPNVLLTAAHCLPSWVTGEPSGSTLRVLVFQQLPSGELHRTFFRTAIGFRHASFSGHADAGDDVGLIILSSPLRGASRPIWLGKLDRGDHLYIHGWGMNTNDESGDSRHLRQGKDGAPISVSRRRKNYFRARGRKARICEGDSGGPAFRLTDGQTFLAGIASNSLGARDANCTKEGRYMEWHRVQGHMDWIEGRIGPCGRFRTSRGQLYARCY